jgi:hypothetical protein
MSSDTHLTVRDLGGGSVLSTDDAESRDGGQKDGVAVEHGG